MSSESEISALIALLDDTDVNVSEHVYNKLLSLGESIVPTLEKAWESADDQLQNERLLNLIQEIRSQESLHKFTKWYQTDKHDLLQALYLIAKLQYPSLKFNEIEQYTTNIQRKVWEDLQHYDSSLEQINIINQVLYKLIGFKVYPTNQLDVRHYCIQNIIENRKGNVTSLAIFYLLIARRLNLPIYGVTLRNHFILAYCKEEITNFEDTKLNTGKVLFYINPSNRGMIFSQNEIKSYLQRIKQEPNIYDFAPCSDLDAVRIVVKELIAIYISQNKPQEEGIMRNILHILSS